MNQNGNETSAAIDTLLTGLGRDAEANHGIVNPPIYRASTVTFESVAALEAATQRPFEGVYYGRHGTPTTFAFEDSVAALDGGYEKAVATSSGLAAITIALLSQLKQGDHLLMVDSVYGPTRSFCDHTLRSLGIDVTYYEPRIGSGIEVLMQPNTRVVFCESPGSLTFELQDIPAISAVAHHHGALVMTDNTWGTPLYFRAFEHGVDVCIHAATKYLVGHADAMLGVITTANERLWRAVKQSAVRLGNCPGPEACWLGLRGLRTLSVRLARHQQSALEIASWLEGQDWVASVLHPGLPSSPDHALWQRDFLGACGLFAVELNMDQQAVNQALDKLHLFGLGYSWGGFESLALPANGGIKRAANEKSWDKPVVRLHIGLESSEDLMQDLQQAFVGA